MARQEIPLQNLPGTPETAEDPVMAWTAADKTNFDTCEFVDGLIILARNTNAGANATARIEGAPDRDKRTRNQQGVVAISGAGEIHAFGPFKAEGWRQTSGQLNFRQALGSGDIEWACLDPRVT